MSPRPKPRVSVLLPVFNGAAHLARAIESIRQQTFPSWELVVIDDGSTDDSASIAAATAASDPRIHLLRQEHQGIAPALNAGIASTRASLIARMDADDESHPQRLERQVAAMDAEPDTDLLGCRVEFGGDPASGAGYALHLDWLNSIITHRNILLSQFIESPFAHPSVMFRRELVARHGAYAHGPFPEDYELWLRWLEAGIRTAKVPETLLRWNDPPNRLSRIDDRYSPESFYRLKAGFLARWISRNVAPSRTLLAWGAGRLTRRRIELFEKAGLRVHGFIDIDPTKQGARPDGRVVLSPKDIPRPRLHFILGCVANRGAREAQRAFLQERGYIEGHDFLFAA